MHIGLLDLEVLVIKLTRWALILIATVIAVIVAIANRHDVAVVFDPFSPQTPFLSIEAPLFSVIFVALFIGMLIGGVTVWVSGFKFRKRARTFKRRIRNLEKKEATAPEVPVPALPDMHSD